MEESEIDIKGRNYKIQKFDNSVTSPVKIPTQSISSEIIAENEANQGKI
jgi:hypothetical protein